MGQLGPLPRPGREKFACSIAEVTDPLALEVLPGTRRRSRSAVLPLIAAPRVAAERHLCAPAPQAGSPVVHTLGDIDHNVR